MGALVPSGGREPVRWPDFTGDSEWSGRAAGRAVHGLGGGLPNASPASGRGGWLRSPTTLACGGARAPQISVGDEAGGEGTEDPVPVKAVASVHFQSPASLAEAVVDVFFAEQGPKDRVSVLLKEFPKNVFPKQ